MSNSTKVVDPALQGAGQRMYHLVYKVLLQYIIKNHAQLLDH